MELVKFLLASIFKSLDIKIEFDDKKFILCQVLTLLIVTLISIILFILSILSIYNTVINPNGDFIIESKWFTYTILLNITSLGVLISLFINKVTPSEKRIKETRKKYPKLSIVAIINQYYERDIFKSFYLVLIALLIYVFIAQIFSFTMSTIFLIILFSLILLLFLSLVVLNFRIRQGWYGGNESEAREIINFALKNSDDIDFTDDGQSKRLFNEEDIEEICLELGIPVPGFSLTSSANQNLGRLGENK